jgi:hypothetical protein
MYWDKMLLESKHRAQGWHDHNYMFREMHACAGLFESKTELGKLQN